MGWNVERRGSRREAFDVTARCEARRREHIGHSREDPLAHLLLAPAGVGQEAGQGAQRESCPDAPRPRAGLWGGKVGHAPSLARQVGEGRQSLESQLHREFVLSRAYIHNRQHPNFDAKNVWFFPEVYEDHSGMAFAKHICSESEPTWNRTAGEF